MEVGDEEDEAVMDTCVLSCLVTSPELIVSSPIRNDCEFIWIDSDEDSCASLISVVSSFVFISCDPEMCLEELCLSGRGEEIDFDGQYTVCFSIHSDKYSPVKRFPFFERF